MQRRHEGDFPLKNNDPKNFYSLDTSEYIRQTHGKLRTGYCIKMAEKKRMREYQDEHDDLTAAEKDTSHKVAMCTASNGNNVNFELRNLLVNHRASKLIDFPNILIYTFSTRNLVYLRDYVNHCFSPRAHVGVALNTEMDEKTVNFFGVSPLYAALEAFFGYFSLVGSLEMKKTMLKNFPDHNCSMVTYSNDLRSTMTAQEYLGTYFLSHGAIDSLLEVMDVSKLSEVEKEEIMVLQESPLFKQGRFIFTDKCYGRVVISSSNGAIISYTVCRHLKSFTLCSVDDSAETKSVGSSSGSVTEILPSLP